MKIPNFILLGNDILVIDGLCAKACSKQLSDSLSMSCASNNRLINNKYNQIIKLYSYFLVHNTVESMMCWFSTLHKEPPPLVL